jgi:hypothetical protein
MSHLRIQLHDFEYTSGRSRLGSKRLRFTFTWSYAVEGTDTVYAWSIPGCLAVINKRGELVWSPPMLIMGGMRKHACYESPDLYHLVRNKLESLGFADAMRRDAMEILREKDVFSEDPQLPRVVEETV